ncbi:hypothetical protein STEG23_018594 [Scotinomys teguina]
MKLGTAVLQTAEVCKTPEKSPQQHPSGQLLHTTPGWDSVLGQMETDPSESDAVQLTIDPNRCNTSAYTGNKT